MNIQREIASPQLRACATAINFFVATWPAIILHLADIEESELNNVESAHWLRAIALFVAVFQTFLSYKMRGSLGYVSCGLAVEMDDGTKLTLRATLVRASVFWAWLLLLYARNIIVESLGLKASGWMSIVLMMFMIASGVALFISGQSSLIDMLSKTRVYKRHSIKLI